MSEERDAKILSDLYDLELARLEIEAMQTNDTPDPSTLHKRINDRICQVIQDELGDNVKIFSATFGWFENE